MAGRNPQTYAKRAREIALRERRERKREKKAEAAAQRAAAAAETPTPESGESDAPPAHDEHGADERDEAEDHGSR